MGVCVDRPRVPDASYIVDTTLRSGWVVCAKSREALFPVSLRYMMIDGLGEFLDLVPQLNALDTIKLFHVAQHCF